MSNRYILHKDTSKGIVLIFVFVFTPMFLTQSNLVFSVVDEFILE